MEHWPNPSLWQKLLLENPWPAVAVLGLTAVMLGWLAWRERSRKLGIIALLLIGTAAAIVPVARAIVTQREHLIQLTAELVEAGVPPLEADVLERMLAENVVFEVPANNPILTDRPSVIELARRAEQAYSVQMWEMAYVDAALLADDHGSAVSSPSNAQSFVLVTTKLVSRGSDILAGFELGIPTEWLIDWRLTADGWRVSRITLRKIAGHEAYPSQLP